VAAGGAANTSFLDGGVTPPAVVGACSAARFSPIHQPSPLIGAVTPPVEAHRSRRRRAVPRIPIMHRRPLTTYRVSSEGELTSTRDKDLTFLAWGLVAWGFVLAIVVPPMMLIGLMGAGYFGLLRDPLGVLPDSPDDADPLLKGLLAAAIIPAVLLDKYFNKPSQPTSHRGRPYVNRCWSCKSSIDSSVHSRCTVCGWYHCGKCGACARECSGREEPQYTSRVPEDRDVWWDEPPPQGGCQLDDGSWYDPHD
jgi:hypothetical protein